MKAVLHDVSRCRGCMKCVEACAVENGLVANGAEARFSTTGLSAKRLTAIERTSDDRFVRRHCLHCLEPACAAACLVGALHKSEAGPVVYDAAKCIGCRYCMLACPFEMVKYEWDSTFPLVKKCEMCHDRPGGPACVEACPHDATLFGEREDLLRIAHERICSAPDRYLNKVWGEKEMGGTGVLYVSDVSLDRYWPGQLGETSIPDLTFPLAEKTPFLALGAAGFLVSTSWIIGRRNRLAEERAVGEGGSDRDA